MNEVLNVQSTKQQIQKIQSNGKTFTNKKEIANEFNNFFAEAGIKISRAVKNTVTTPESYLTPKNTCHLDLGKTSPADIVAIIKEMKSKSSTDIDGISMKLLKYVASEISCPLSHIFNLSIQQGIFPKALKQGRVVPIHKGGSTSTCDNYRPIALLSTISKILEKIVSIKLTNHLELNKLISASQFGFQNGKSTEHNLLLLTDYISKALNEGDYCIGVFLDLRKAFDVVSHDILLKKLENLGVVGTALDWFRSYLSERSQRVDLDGNVSDPRDVPISILQGSILGPTLFLIHINDLPEASTLKTFMFADDTQGLARGANLAELIDHVNEELKKWATWFKANKMMVNTSKTKFMIFHTKGKKVEPNHKNIIFNNNEANDLDNPANIFILERYHSNHQSEECRAYKLLGIFIDEHLTLNYHTNTLTKKLAKAIYCLNRSKNILPRKALRTLYFALFHSHITYCTSIVSCTSKSNIQKITNLQKKAIRICTNSNYTAHTAPLFKQLGILPYNKLITQSNLHIMHSAHFKYAPAPFHNLWPTNLSRNLTQSLRNTDEYWVPRANYTFFTRFPAYNLAKLWNETGVVKLHQNPTTFKIALKHELHEFDPHPHLNLCTYC